MKRLGGILFAAGCLFGIPKGHAQEYSTEFAAKAHAEARELKMLPPEQFSLQWLREEVDPILRERREIRRMMEVQVQETMPAAQSPAPVQDPHATVGNWRFSFGNTSVANWSPYQDRMLDARTLRFPMPRKPKPAK